MKCPNCQTENDSTARYCISCGQALPEAPSAAQLRKSEKAGEAVFALGAKARQLRISAAVDPDAVISSRAYNGVILAVLLWGLVVNYILCRTVGNVYRYVNPTAFLIGYFILALAGILISTRSRNPWISFLGYNMVVVPFGLVISTAVSYWAEVDPAIVTNAFLYTMLISGTMLALALIQPGIFARLGGALLAVLGGLVVCELLLLLFGVNQLWSDWIAAGLFSLYIGYDVYRSQQYPRTLDNAVDSALDIYLDIANLFLRILEIMGRSSSRKHRI